MEESFQASKRLAGLDQHQVRRRTVLAMLAYTFLTVVAATERADNRPPRGLVPLTCNEICHRFNILITNPISHIWHRLAWSTWRRRHQHGARTSHYKRRASPP